MQAQSAWGTAHKLQVCDADTQEKDGPNLQRRYQCWSAGLWQQKPRQDNPGNDRECIQVSTKSTDARCIVEFLVNKI